MNKNDSGNGRNFPRFTNWNHGGRMLARVAVMSLVGLAAARGWSQAPQIVTSPQSQTVSSGANVTFTVSATGAVPLTYQWQFDGVNIGLAAGTITTVAGGGGGGDGSPATNAAFLFPRSVAVDAVGNMYVADQEHNTIRKVDTNGFISTMAGNGVGTFGGDGGLANAANLQFPFGVTVDNSGNVFIADFYNQRIRKVGTNGIITTVAGSGASGPNGGAFAGDGGPATSARLHNPTIVAVDAIGELFIVDSANNRIRKVDTNGIITTLAGGGTNGLGDGGQATNATLSGPNGVAVDAFGNVFIADSSNVRVRKVDTNGIITTVAGGGTGSLGDGGPATNATLNNPTGVVVDGFGNLFIADAGAERIREVNASGIVTTVAGNGTAAFSGDGGQATDASLYYPYQATVDGFGNLFIADMQNQRIRKVTINGGPMFNIANVNTNDDGNYSVVVANQYGSATSAVAVLTVNPAECTAPPAGLVGWWAGEDNAVDNTGLNNGTLVSGVTFATGEVGQAFDLNGSSQYVDVPNSPSLNPTNAVTLEAWISPGQFLNSPIIKKNIPGTGQYALEMDPSGGVLFGVFLNGAWVTTISAPVPLGLWTHVAGVYNGSNISIYVNGALGASTPATGTIVPVAVDLQIGHDSAIPSRYFLGLIDEASVYSTALSAAQIQAIYNAFSAGKCVPAPFITAQPQSESLYPGGTASFTVAAGGGQPLSYQWQENMTNIPASENPTATSATLVLPGITLAQSGYIYSVQVINGGGVTNSTTAALTVLSPGSCYPPPAGIISWWPGEFSAMDITGTNDGTLVGGVTFAVGEVNEAFKLNGTNQYVDVLDSPSLNPSNSITLEAWINPAQFLNSPPIIKKDNPVSGGYTLELNGSGGVSFGVFLHGAWVTTTAPPIPLNQWTHVAGVYNGANVSVYVNGLLATAPGAATGTIVPAAGHLQIGHDSANPARYFKGLIDEPTVYGTALSAVQIENIYLSGTTGKCSEPEIAMQPQSQGGYSGGNVFLNVTVAGVGPFTYQWNYNGSAISGATNASYSIGNAQVGNSGSYTVTITNPYGTVTSSAATVIVNPPGLALALYPGLTITGAPGATYGIQYLTNLTDTNDWIGLANVTLTDTNQLFFDLTPANQQHRFYRAVPGPIPIP